LLKVLQVIKGNNMNTYAVNYDELERRIDPSAYHPTRLNAVKRIKSLPYKVLPLNQVATFKREIVTKTDKNTPYIGLENIETNTGIASDIEQGKKFGSAFNFKAGNILFPKLRPYLNKVHLATSDGVCSTEFHILEAIKCSNYYLFAFLNSDTVVQQTSFLMTGNTLPRLQTEDVESLLVPLLPEDKQTQITNLLKNAYKNREKKLKQADELLNSIDGYIRQQLGITYTEPEEKPTFTTSSNEVKGKRLDPKKYSQKPKAILTAIKKAKYSQLPLNNLIVANISGEWGNDLFDNNAKADKDTVQVKVLRNTNFDNSLNLNLEDVAERLIEKNKFVKNKLQNGDILIEKSGGSPIQPVGRVAIFDNIKGDYCFSNFLQCIRINETKCLPYYLFVYLKSIYALNYMEYLQNQTTGIKNLIWEEFTDTPIVLPPKDTQEKLAEEAKDRMTKATALRHEASTVLDEAKKQVEEIILN